MQVSSMANKGPTCSSQSQVSGQAQDSLPRLEVFGNCKVLVGQTASQTQSTLDDPSNALSASEQQQMVGLGLPNLEIFNNRVYQQMQQQPYRVVQQHQVQQYSQEQQQYLQNQQQQYSQVQPQHCSQVQQFSQMAQQQNWQDQQGQQQLSQLPMAQTFSQVNTNVLEPKNLQLQENQYFEQHEPQILLQLQYSHEQYQLQGQHPSAMVINIAYVIAETGISAAEFTADLGISGIETRDGIESTQLNLTAPGPPDV